MLMRSGPMRHRVEVQTPVRTADDAGGSEVAFVTLGRYWAAIKTTAVREGNRADSQVSDATHEVTLRYLAGLTAGCRLVFSGRTFEVVGQPEDVDERHRETRVRVNEVS